MAQGSRARRVLAPKRAIHVSAVLEILQTLLPIGISERPRIDGQLARACRLAFRFVIIAASIKPARRVRNKFPLGLSVRRPSSQRTPGFFRSRQ